MEVTVWRYYLVPASLGMFGLAMTFLLRRCMKDGLTRMERELQELTIDAKS